MSLFAGASNLRADDTIKVVRIKDRHLGALRAFFLLGVLLYVVVYVLAYKRERVVVLFHIHHAVPFAESYWDTSRTSR